ncbi:MAG: choice-of-anchor L domain-containing protein, partial [Flavobacteriales bacterium]
MKKRLLPLVLLFSIFGYSQITIDESFTTQELIEDILLTSSSCAQVSDFGQRTGTDFGEGNGIGAFFANGSDFPFESGIILSSGYVSNAPGPNLTIHSDGTQAWLGSTVLEANTTATNTNNASMIQFNFVPLLNQISFNFLFASEEYNQLYECSFSDAFAFVLTDQTTGVVQNLAVLPGTNIPIEATNIHPDVPGVCPAINEEYFDKYNFLPFNDENLAAIDYNGQIQILTAQGSVTPGNLYTIQLVIADETDTALDSAVFLEAGSFDLGNVDLGLDLTIEDGTALCEGDTYVITPEIEGPDGTSFEWFYEDPLDSGIFVPFSPPETGPILEITQSGRYKLVIDFNGQCTSEGEVLIEYTVPPTPLDPPPLVVCDDDNDGFAEFI